MKKLISVSLLLLGLIPNLCYAQTYLADQLLELILGGPGATEDWWFDGGNLRITTPGDRTRYATFDVTNITTGTNRNIKFQDNNYTMAGIDIANTFIAGVNQTFDGKIVATTPTGTASTIETVNTVSSGLSGGKASGIWNLSPVLTNPGDDVGSTTYLRVNSNIDQATDGAYRGLQLSIDVQSDGASHTGNNTISGLDFIARTSGTSSGGTITSVRGMVGSAQHNATSDVLGSLSALDMQVSSGPGSGPVTTANGMRFSSITARSAWTELYQYRAINPSISGGSIGTVYGYYCPDITNGTARWAFHQAGTTVNAFSGRTKFAAVTSPMASIDIAAGTTSQAAMRLVAGTLLTTPDSSSVETSGDDIYYTIPTGEARKKIVLDDGTNLVSGTVPIATTNGRLTNGFIFTDSTYTPTLDNTTNVAASTAYSCQYVRTGNVVTVSGKVDVDPTANTTNTVLGISLPVPSNFSANENCGGAGSTYDTVQQAGAIRANVANDRAELVFFSSSLANLSWGFSFTYKIKN